MGEQISGELEELLDARLAKWKKETEELARTPGRELFGVMNENGWAEHERLGE